METENSVPVIDLQDFPRQSSKLIWACEEWGCFRILNHDNILPVSLMAEMKKVVRALLDLPTEIKKRNKDVIEGSGYMAPSEKNPLYEALGLYDMSSPEDVDAFCTQLDASPPQRFDFYSFSFLKMKKSVLCALEVGDEVLIMNSRRINCWYP